MAYSYMDESGDLGFDFAKPRTGKYFVVAFLFANDRKDVERVIKKIFADFSKRETNRFLNENFSDYLRVQTQRNHNGYRGNNCYPKRR